MGRLRTQVGWLLRGSARTNAAFDELHQLRAELDQLRVEVAGLRGDLRGVTYGESPIARRSHRSRRLGQRTAGGPRRMRRQLACVVRGSDRTQDAFDDHGTAIRDLQRHVDELRSTVTRLDTECGSDR